jgi:hypothetical protein
MNRWSSVFVRLALLLTGVLVSPPSRADERLPDVDAYYFAFRLHLGGGIGETGPGMAAGASSEVWFSRYVGAGAFARVWEQQGIGIFGEGPTSEGPMAGGMMTWRTAPCGRTFYFRLGGGFAQVTQQGGTSCSFLGGGCSGRPPEQIGYGFAWYASLGHAWHQGFGELGVSANVAHVPVVRAGTFTIEVELGFVASKEGSPPPGASGSRAEQRCRAEWSGPPPGSD